MKEAEVTFVVRQIGRALAGLDRAYCVTLLT